jgi:uncharacterized membrane protein
VAAGVVAGAGAVAVASAVGAEVSAEEAPAAAGKDMKPDEFLDKIDDAAVTEAIRRAEETTSGEIRVFISRRELGSDDVMSRATTRFAKLGMMRTRDRNAVLLYFIPRAQKFAIVGDAAVHAKCGQTLWENVAAQIGDSLRKGEFTRAIIDAVAAVAAALALHFPKRSDDRNELPNEPIRD